MDDQPVSNPIELIKAQGGLHDARIDELLLGTDAQSLSLVVDDFNKSFAGMNNYPGCRPVILRFDGVSELKIDVDFEEGIRISDLVIVTEASGYRLEIDLNLGGGSATGGRRSIQAKFASLSIAENPATQ